MVSLQFTRFLRSQEIMSAFIGRLVAVCQSGDSGKVHCQGQLLAEREDWESAFLTAHFPKFAALL
jgi:hypothetical protein